MGLNCGGANSVCYIDSDELIHSEEQDAAVLARYHVIRATGEPETNTRKNSPLCAPKSQRNRLSWVEEVTELSR